MNTKHKDLQRLTLLAIRKELGPAYADGERVIVPGWSFSRFRNFLDALDHLAKYGDENGPMRRLLHKVNNA
jgi:hypothetical protein